MSQKTTLNTIHVTEDNTQYYTCHRRQHAILYKSQKITLNTIYVTEDNTQYYTCHKRQHSILYMSQKTTLNTTHVTCNANIQCTLMKALTWTANE